MTAKHDNAGGACLSCPISIRLPDALATERDEAAGLADSLPVRKGRFAGLRKHLIGDCWTVFAILDHTVLITRIRHRGDVYRD
jgi:hypothetical protein